MIRWQYKQPIFMMQIQENPSQPGFQWPWRFCNQPKSYFHKYFRSNELNERILDDIYWFRWHKTYNIISKMQYEFLTTFKRKSQRERFYSSMNYEQYYEIYGPPAPLVKPQEDPVDQIPLLQLETPLPPPQNELNKEDPGIVREEKMETILEIDGSQNFTQNMQKSPKNEFLFSSSKQRATLSAKDEIQVPKRLRVRMRSQSDNSEYLIFNFLQRVNEKGRKKVKLE